MSFHFVLVKKTFSTSFPPIGRVYVLQAFHQQATQWLFLEKQMFVLFFSYLLFHPNFLSYGIDGRIGISQLLIKVI